MSRISSASRAAAIALMLLLTALAFGSPASDHDGNLPVVDGPGAAIPGDVGPGVPSVPEEGARANDTEGPNGSAPEYTPRTLHVGGGSYETVQDAVDASEPGDTIVIRNGTYYETVRVWVRDITLTGEDVDGVVIDGGGEAPYCVIVTAPGVTVSNFSVARSKEGIAFGAGLYIDEDALGAVITGMQAYGNGVNGYQLDAPGTELRNSSAWKNEFGGVLVNATGCLVADCSFWDGIVGIRIHSKDNHITRNEIHHFKAHGIHVGDTGNLVEYNDLYIIPDALEPINVYEPEQSTIRHNREFHVADPGGDGGEPYVEDGSFIRSPFMLFAFFLLAVLGVYLLFVRPLWRRGREKRLLAEAERRREEERAAQRERERAERGGSRGTGGKRRKKGRTRGPRGRRRKGG